MEGIFSLKRFMWVIEFRITNFRWLCEKTLHDVASLNNPSGTGIWSFSKSWMKFKHWIICCPWKCWYLFSCLLVSEYFGLVFGSCSCAQKLKCTAWKSLVFSLHSRNGSSQVIIDVRCRNVVTKVNGWHRNCHDFCN